MGNAPAAPHAGAASEFLNARLSGASTFQELALRVVQTCAAVANAELSTFWRVYEDVDEHGRPHPRLKLAAAHGVEAPQTLAQEVTYAITPNGRQDGTYDGLTGYVASERKAVHIHAFEELPRDYSFCHSGKMDGILWKDRPASQMRNLYAVPLVLGSEVLGVLKVENHAPAGDFSPADIRTMDELAKQVAIVSKAMVLLDSHERDLIDAPARLAQALVRPFEMGKLTQTIVDTTAEILRAKVCSLWFADPPTQRLVHQANYGVRGKKSAVPSYRIYPQETEDCEIDGITAWVATRRTPFWANSHAMLRQHPSWRGKWDPSMFGGEKQAEEKFRSLYAVPLTWHDETLGVLKVENPRETAHFTPADQLKCALMANYVVLLLKLTQQFRSQLVPEFAHILNSSTGQVAGFIRQIDKELQREHPRYDRLSGDVDMVKRAALTIAAMSRTLSAEVGQRFRGQQQASYNLPKLLDSHIALIKPLIPYGVRIAKRYAVDEYQASLTPSECAWLEIVIFNLVHNAIKYSPEGGVIDVELLHQGGETIIAVTDDGPGIDPGIIDRVFEPNVKTTNPHWPHSAGLGLFTVRRLLGQIGWHIKALNLADRGARFEIHIPAGWRNDDE